MLFPRRLSLIILTLSLSLHAQQPPTAAGNVDWSPDRDVKAEARIVGQRYCEGDADVFTDKLDLRVRVTNNSKRSLYLRSDMVPDFIRVSSSLEAARQGRYMYEFGGGVKVWSADQKFPPVRETRILPHHSVFLSVTGVVIARYRTDFSVPATVVPGRYALQLLLQPEKDFPHFDHAELKSLVVEPVAFAIGVDPHPTQCH
jgi:hypothetical protein